MAEWEIPDIHHERPQNRWKLRPENQTQEVCVTCGKTFTKIYWNMKKCPECIKTCHGVHISKRLCTCGRRIRYPETKCSFCEKRDRKIESEILRAQRRALSKKKIEANKCGKCGKEISPEDAKTFDGLCAECHVKKQVRWDF